MDNNNPYQQTEPEPANRYAANPYADFTTPDAPPPSHKKRNKVIIIVAAITLLLLIIGLVVAFAPNSRNDSESANSSVQSITTEVPADWVYTETGFGFDAAIPASWGSQAETENVLGTLETRTIGLGPPENGFIISDASGDEELSPFSIITVGTSKRTDLPDQAAFERLVSDKNETSAAAYEEQGVNKEELMLTGSLKTINDVQWLETYSEMNDIYTKTLYRWDNEQAVTVILVSDNQAKLDADYEKYLLPIAVSTISQ